MRRLLILAIAGGFAFSLGSAIAQEEENEFALPSKIVPAEIYACNYNDGQGPSDLNAAVDGWSAYMDQNNIDNYAAWTLGKYHTGPDQDFDFLWLGAWTDGNAMGAGTDMWLSSGGEHIADFARVADCFAHANSASINYKMPEGGTPANAVLTFSNCNINDGKSYAAIGEATRAWADVLTEAGSEAAIYHWFPVYGGGGDSPDFTVLTAYPNFTELGADYERLTNGELFRKSGELFGDLEECDVARVYTATQRRAAVLR